MTMHTTKMIAAFNLLALQLDHKPDDLHEVHLNIKEMIT